jgi:hypothetical protein
VDGYKREGAAVNRETAAAVLIAATACADLDAAVSWLSEGRQLRSDAYSWRDTFAALSLLPESPLTSEALRRVATRSAVSQLDSSADLLALERVMTPERYASALQTLKVHALGGLLGNLTAEAVHAAQSDNDDVISCLCEVAGLSYRDLADRLRTSGEVTPPGEPESPWSIAQTKAAWKIIDSYVTGKLTAKAPGATPARALEQLFGVPGQEKQGWPLIDELTSHGVPYSLLLAQRGAGGAWLAHRNRTNNLLVAIVVEQIQTALADAKVETLTQGALGRRRWLELMGSDGLPLQLCAIRRNDDHDPEPLLGITVANARDGGTVRKSAGTLKVIPARFADLPLAAVVIGPGWADRVLDTAELGRAFSGRVFTDMQLAGLAQLAVSLQ